MRSARHLLLAAALMVGGGNDLGGQTGRAEAAALTPPVPIGTGVRISARGVSPDRITGELVELSETDSGATLSVWSSETSELRDLPIAAIEKLERFAGRKRNTLKGAIWGAGINLALSLPVQAGCDDTDSFYKYCYDGVGDWVISIGVGAAFGALIGTFIKSDRWREVPVDTSLDTSVVRVSLGAIAPGRAGVPGLGLRLTW